MAKMVIDRFVSVEPIGQRGGTLRTVPLRVPAEADGTLVVDAAASNGRLRAQVHSESGAILPGFTFDDCVAVTSDGRMLPVSWKDDAHLPKGRIIQIDFELTEAKLFAFEWYQR